MSDVARVFDAGALLVRFRPRAAELGFLQIGVAGVGLASAEAGLTEWLRNGFHGSMSEGWQKAERRRLESPATANASPRPAA